MKPLYLSLDVRTKTIGGLEDEGLDATEILELHKPMNVLVGGQICFLCSEV